MQYERLLVDDHRLTHDALEQARRRARETRRSLADVLVDDGFVSEVDVLRAQSRQFGIAFVVIGEMAVDQAAVAMVSSKLCAHYGVMPLRIDAATLTLAVSDPLDLAAVEDLEAHLGRRVERVLACREDIRRAIDRYYGVGADTVAKILNGARAEEPAPVAAAESHDLETMADDASVVRLVNQVLQEAIADRATDIHFEAERDGVRLRRRVDGLLVETSVPGDLRFLYPAIVSRVKLMAGLNIVERRLPQDGRARVVIGRHRYDLRISVVPAMHGEDIVVRILPSSMLLDLGELGYEDTHLQMLGQAIRKPHGIIFVTGPTGSGKSTTLYACLNQLNTPERKIVTIEDPVEYELRGITQTQVHPHIGLTFAHSLRSMLRHDPDIMMVGEVRDLETALIAVQAAMTGHLVLSTLHTNDAASAPIRLIEMGVEPYLVASTLELVVAQRLVRRICPTCKESFETPDGVTRFRGRGCRACNRSGYRGRTAISELMTIPDEIQELILVRASAKQIRSRADALHMPTLARDGADKAARGWTTMDEVMRVTNV